MKNFSKRPVSPILHSWGDNKTNIWGDNQLNQDNFYWLNTNRDQEVNPLNLEININQYKKKNSLNEEVLISVKELNELKIKLYKKEQENSKLKAEKKNGFNMIRRYLEEIQLLKSRCSILQSENSSLKNKLHHLKKNNKNRNKNRNRNRDIPLI